MTTKTQHRVQKKYAGFVQLTEAVASELYPTTDWDSVSSFEHREMLESIYTTAFERDPEAFKGIQWINDEDGLPAWVRPGVEWEQA